MTMLIVEVDRKGAGMDAIEKTPLEKTRKLRQAELSFAALQAVIVAAGGTVVPPSQSADAQGVDALCMFEGEFSKDETALQSVDVHFQLKSTSRRPASKTYDGIDYWAFPVDVKRLKKYARNRQTPLFLCLFVVSPNEDEWVKSTNDGVLICGSLYWVPLRQYPIDETRIRNIVYIPKTATLTPETTRRIVATIAERKNEEALRYGTSF